MGWLKDELDSFVSEVLTDVADWVSSFATSLIDPAMELMIGTPAPQTSNWVFGSPMNAPWSVWVPDVYYQYIIPLAFGLWLLAAAYVGMVSPVITGYNRQKTLQRLGIAFFAMFLWIYFATAATQFFDALSVGIAPTASEMVSTFGDVVRTAVSGTIMTIIMMVVQNVLVLFAIAVYAIRYVMIYVLTLGMPLLFVFWALDVGPMKRFAALARGLMSLFPGLLIATLPSAIMFRMAYETQLDFGAGGLTGMFISLMFIPTATVLTVFVIMRSQSVVEAAASRGSQVAASGGGYTRSVTVTGARDVHRGLRGSSPVSGGAAYTMGQKVSHHAPTSTARSVGSSVASRGTKAGSTLKKTFGKISRW
jgi:hypothetical protein